MERDLLVRKIYDAGGELSVSNDYYCEVLSGFLMWQMNQDLAKSGDVTSGIFFDDGDELEAQVYARSSGVLAGVQEVNCLIGGGIDVSFLKNDGDNVEAGDLILELKGGALEVLKKERLLLNIMQRMSGIATKTRDLCSMLGDDGALLACTRKTLWGVIDKRAVYLGGGLTHRLNLADAVMVKDTHFDAYEGDLVSLLSRMIELRGDVRFLEFEVSDCDLSCRVVDALLELQFEGEFVLMLDNFNPEGIEECLSKLNREKLPFDLVVEASGGITEANLAAYQKTGVDVISTSLLTMNSPALDFNMKIARS